MNFKDLSFAVAFILPFAGNAHDEQCSRSFYYEPDTSVVTGWIDIRISARKAHEPGQNEEFFVLKLSYPIDVIAYEADELNTESFTAVSEFQIANTNFGVVREHKNECVEVSGKFFQAHSAHHFTDILMDVANITYLPDSKCRK